MADTEKRSRDVLHVASQIVCFYPGLKDLRPDQLAALHVFKHEFLAAGFRLYEVISPQVAHPILVNFLQQLVTEFENDQDP